MWKNETFSGCVVNYLVYFTKPSLGRHEISPQNLKVHHIWVPGHEQESENLSPSVNRTQNMSAPPEVSRFSQIFFMGHSIWRSLATHLLKQSFCCVLETEHFSLVLQPDLLHSETLSWKQKSTKPKKKKNNRSSNNNNKTNWTSG